MDDPLIEAAYGDDSRKLRELLRKGVDPNRPTPEGDTALYIAAGNPEKTRLLLEAGAVPDTEGPEGTPLCFAACWGEAESVSLLLSHGANPDHVEHGNTPVPSTALLLAAGNGHDEVVRLLLEAGADPNLAANEGQSPLMTATQRGSLGIARLLLEHGADPGATDDDGETALDLAEKRTGKDLEAELRTHVDKLAGSGDEIVVRRTPQPDGTDLVEVELVRSKGGGIVSQLQTGHAEIAKILRDS